MAANGGSLSEDVFIFSVNETAFKKITHGF